MAHLSTIRHFSFSVKDKYEIQMKYNIEKWERVINTLGTTQQITNSAIRISHIIKIKLGIELFPTVFKVAGGAWDRGGGTASFMMFGFDNNSKELECFLFDSPAKRYKATSGIYDINIDESGNTWIYRIENQRNQ